MSYSYPNSGVQISKPRRPKLLSMLFAFAITTMIGIIIGQISSFFYTLLGQGGGLECVTFPIILVIFGGSMALSFFLTRKLNKTMGRGK